MKQIELDRQRRTVTATGQNSRDQLDEMQRDVDAAYEKAREAEMMVRVDALGVMPLPRVSCALCQVKAKDEELQAREQVLIRPALHALHCC